MTKWLIRISLVLVGLFVGLSVLGFFLRKSWGKDLRELRIHGTRESDRFTAARQPNGVWFLEAENDEALWFGQGYLQTWDRWFQLELVRLMATGRLGELAGESVQKRDRLYRIFAVAAYEEWQGLASDDPIRRASEAFVRGREAAISNSSLSLPIEYRTLNLNRSGFGKWMPWELLAIARFHAWSLSGDSMNETRRWKIMREKGLETALKFHPPESSNSVAMYEQPLVSGVVSGGFLKSSARSRAYPLMDAKTLKDPVNANGAAGDTALWMPSEQMDLFGSSRWLGASNAWLVHDTKTARSPTLCNDTHLQLSWPSPLYPLKWAVRSKGDSWVREATGWSMPGVPATVIGSWEKKSIHSKTVQRSLIWGMTMGSFADMEDLVELRPEQIAGAKKIELNFTNKSLAGTEVKTVQQEWTDWGPRVDEFWDGLPSGVGPVALDWIGLRKSVSSPFAFFLGLNMDGPTDLMNRVNEQFSYPAMNFFWTAYDGQQGLKTPQGARSTLAGGHVLTGVLYKRSFDSRRTSPVLQTSDLAVRTLSLVSDRPLVWKDFSFRGRDLKFGLFNANQKIFRDSVSADIAWDWNHPERASRVVQLSEEIFRDPGAAQRDFLDPYLADFARVARQKVDVDRLCGRGTSGDQNLCRRIVSEIDAWNGDTSASRWEPTLVSLWLANFKKSQWGNMGDEDFVNWAKLNASQRAVPGLLRASTPDSIVESFQKTFETLTSTLGPRVDLWNWGKVHRVAWQHPFGLLPGGMGRILLDGMLGPPPEVGGSFGAPMQMAYRWKPSDPLNFAVSHGPAMRMCASLDEKSGSVQMTWENITGVSGNPFSEYSRLSVGARPFLQ